jgi:hypothetical protein
MISSLVTASSNENAPEVVGRRGMLMAGASYQAERSGIAPPDRQSRLPVGRTQRSHIWAITNGTSTHALSHRATAARHYSQKLIAKGQEQVYSTLLELVFSDRTVDAYGTPKDQEVAGLFGSSLPGTSRSADGVAKSISRRRSRLKLERL